MDQGKRKRFDDYADEPASKKKSVDVAAATLKATELSKDLNNKVMIIYVMVFVCS